MIFPILHSTLFKTSKKEVLENYKVSETEASKWYKLNYLSFDFDTLDEFEESQFIEIIFIKKLINSCKNDTFFNYLLSKLQKPYSYNFHKIYFDVFEDEWKELPVIKEISDYSFEEIIDELLENSHEENKIEIISEYITKLSSRLIE
jgi:hypothetical protein